MSTNQKYSSIIITDGEKLLDVVRQGSIEILASKQAAPSAGEEVSIEAEQDCIEVAGRSSTLEQVDIEAGQESIEAVGRGPTRLFP